MERVVVYVVTEKDDCYELPLFVGDSLKQCADFLGCCTSDIWYSVYFHRLIAGKYYVDALWLD